MPDTETETEDSLQDAIASLEVPLERVQETLDALETAETVENARDFCANVDDALASARALVTALEEIRSGL